MWKIRSARIKEAIELTKLAAEAEAYWCYDDECVELYKIIFSITPEIISEDVTSVLERDGKIIGFYSIAQEGYLGYINHFYISPNFMGQGYGKIMWNHMVDVCEGLGMLEVELISCQPARDFYKKMGAELIKELDSKIIEGRKVSHLRVKVFRKLRKM